MEGTSASKLKLPLLRRENDVVTGVGTLAVNFDPLLTRLLREVKYFLLLGFDVPEAALEIYSHDTVFRKHRECLHLIVNMRCPAHTNHGKRAQVYPS